MIEQYQAEGAEEFKPQGDEGAEPETGFAEQQEQAPQPRSLEDIASKMGWTPREAWRGDPDKWKPADQFVEHTAEVNSRLVTKLKSVDERLENVSRTSAAMMERALAKQREELLAARQDAFDVGDAEKFTQVERELQSLQSINVPPSVAPEVQGFVEKHASWWQKDQEATTWAINRAGQLGEQGITSPARQVAIVERELAQMFPELVAPEKPKAKPAPLTQPGNRGGNVRAKTFNDLPAEAQKEARYFEKKGVAVEEYVKEYFAGQD